MIGWAWNNAWWIIPALAYFVVVSGVFIVAGRAAAIAVATAGVAHLAYIVGGGREREFHDRRAKEIDRKRNEAYDEIDNRNYDRGDASKRMRDNDY